MKEEMTTADQFSQVVVKAIKKIMIDRNLKHKQLSQMVGVHPSQLSAVFNGKRPFRFDLLTRIADALGVQISFSLEKMEKSNG